MYFLRVLLFLVNSQPTNRISPQRGLRQGDPISLYLFLLCAEGLGGLICKAQLFFADDSIIFARANLENAAAVKNILHIYYEQLSGQKTNVEKSEISFSRGLGHDNRNMICPLLYMEEVLSHNKYLGLPTIFDRSKKISFSGIRDHIWKKLQGWKVKLLSKAGKEILIKSFIPCYAMSYFNLPSSFFKEVDCITRCFWWGSHSSQGIPWKAWSFLCRPKRKGA